MTQPNMQVEGRLCGERIFRLCESFLNNIKYVFGFVVTRTGNFVTEVIIVKMSHLPNKCLYSHKILRVSIVKYYVFTFGK